MATKTIIPPTRVPVVGSDGLMTTPWRRYFDEVDLILGGGTNVIEATQNRDIYDSTAYVSALDYAIKRIENIEKWHNYSQVSELNREYNAVSKAVDYTAVDYDFVNATASAVITLPQYPISNSVVIVRNGDGSTITVSGNGHNINSSATILSGVKSTTMVFHYFIDSSEWFIR